MPLREREKIQEVLWGGEVMKDRFKVQGVRYKGSKKK